MADDTNEDSWLYGTSNPDSTTTENASDALAAEHEALAAVTGEKPGSSTLPGFPKEEMPEYGEFEDPAKEMEEDEEALPDTTDIKVRRGSGSDTAGSGMGDDGSQHEDAEMTDMTEGAPGTTSRKERMGSGSDEDDDDDSDDDINVVIGDIKSAPSTYNIKQRSNLLAATGDKAKPATQGGKFSIEDFEGAGTINGVAVHEFSIDSLEEKPWRKPGADITDYFNYGFNEETWRAYCERQKRFRVAESGVGLASLTQNVNQSANSGGMPDGGGSNITVGLNMGGAPMHHHQSMGVMGDGPMQMPPPGMPPIIQHQPRPGMGMMARPPRPISTTGGVKENAIQVMTAECREYSRGGLGPMAPNFPPPGAADEPFFHEPEPFDYGYEPTQESQWNNDNAGWVPTGIKELTPGPAHQMPQGPQGPPTLGGPPGMPPQMNVPPPQMGGPPPQLRGQHAPPGMMPPNMRMPHNMGMGPPPGMMRMPHNMNMGPQQRMPMGNNSNNTNLTGSPSTERRSGSFDDERERRRREKDKQLKKEQVRKDFMDMLRERHDIERHTRWYDIKKKFEADPRYRALDSAYREEYFEDYLHLLKEEKRKEREHKERDRERSSRGTRDKDKDKDKEKEKEKDKDKDKDKEEKKDREKDKEKEKDKDKDKESSSSSSRRDRSRSKDKSSRRKSKSREKDRSERSSTKQSSSSKSSDKKKSHRKDKEEGE
ncbi:Fip1 [Drosophila busckii]|uniref:Fip1 n=1 Tax=Drosophila busckii TaxID=30019 RepID=A0A0M4EV00_DROBS|nr:pre-mRNA 3'-end-processing factor FIP1 [Drosophila busckii]ALC47017.1 Fip1 [Drosophila busckii]